MADVLSRLVRSCVSRGASEDAILRAWFEDLGAVAYIAANATYCFLSAARRETHYVNEKIALDLEAAKLALRRMCNDRQARHFQHSTRLRSVQFAAIHKT